MKPNRESVRQAFVAICGDCEIQNGWPCRTCFFYTAELLGLPETEAHAFWHGSRDDAMYQLEVVALPAAIEHQTKVRAYQAKRASK